jgi:hypothetical protein
LYWSLSSNRDWINCNVESGTNSSAVKVSVDPTGKAPGTYTGTVVVTANGANYSPQSIDITLNVYQNGQDAEPFGRFESPQTNATVRSSIPVTGWVLDDVGIESVKLYLKTGSQLDLIGNAILVEGARGDVEAAYPGYPNNNKAGWGYMLLTNFLPNQGNGTYTLQAIARDVSGHQVVLGTVTIKGDNANATLPFGALDTPCQGCTVSGSSYVNFGWVLTPMPNSIPIDGSTIDVYIDGIKKGSPVYNNFRKDIATLFPGYANSNGAVGYFYIDTTQLEDGVHTIQWSARDSADNVDGIGSRYFTVQNGNNRAHSQQMKSTSVSRGNINLSSLNNAPPGITKTSNTPVWVAKGFSEHAEYSEISPSRNGIINIPVAQMQRVVIDFSYKQKGSNVKTQIMNLFPLPVGAGIDRENGIFYWQPGLAYKGAFYFDFIVGQVNGIPVKQQVKIVIED